ncbi:hypothetical protein TWF718_009186 [Orbilia javanica]|uniref:F-box domain-containing protein n=1 Tax=Orbilia javanica TaxID=47235 RepID=A0AAN8MRB5_9PEZI
MPFTLAKNAQIPRDPGGWPQVPDTSDGTYRIFESRLFRNSMFQGESFCYPIHNVCLGLFDEIIASCGLKRYPLEIFAFLVLIIGELPFDCNQVYWPSEYGGISEYQKGVKRWRYEIPPRLQYIETLPLDLSGLRKKVDEERENLKENGTEGIENIPSTIPDFIPLPVEVVQQILSFLEWSDVQNLQKIPSTRVIDIPDIFWKNLCMFYEEFGFLGYGEDENSVESWYEMCVLANRLIKQDSPALKNRMRIWSLCVDIFSIATHCALEDDFGIISTPKESKILEITDPTNLLVVQSTPREPLVGLTGYEGVSSCYSGEIDNLAPTGMYVSFKGIGRLRFVSGFKFMPSGQAIGKMNQFENYFVSLDSEVPDKMSVMHVAANSYGIVDISVVSSYSSTPEPVWIGECLLTDCAITRWIIRPSGAKTIISKIILDLSLLTVTNLQILRPSFISPAAMTAEEAFIQKHLWMPKVPVLAAETSLNHDLFYCIRSEAGALEDGDTPSRSRFNPCEYIYSNETITRLSLWSNRLRNDISAIELYTKERGPTPYIVGKATGVSTDIFIDGEGGEYISGTSIVAVEASGAIIGLSISTSYNRKLEISFRDDGQWSGEEGTCVIDLCPKDCGKITGFYCQFNQDRREKTLRGIGVITTKHDDPKPPPEALDTKLSLLMTQLMSPFRQNPDTPVRRQGVIGTGWCFISSLSLKGCTKIIAHIQTDPPFRLSGISVFHAESPILPDILGQIGHAATEQIMSLNAAENEVITKINVYKKRMYVHGRSGVVVVGLGIWTSKVRGSKDHRRMNLGDCKREGVRETTKLKIQESDVLRWEYNESRDSLSVESL